jgi:hypothetical protein
MTAIDCPACGVSVNARATGCPECGADPSLSADQARVYLLAHGLALPSPGQRRVWSRRRRLTVAAVALAVMLVLLSPLWLGYFGPTVAAYAQTWLPWRTHIVVRDGLPADYGRSSRQVELAATYSDPWPGTAATPGEQTRFLTVTRYSPLLPWVVTGSSTGP